MQLSYTWSKAIDQTSDLSNNGMRLPQGQSSPFLFDPHLQRSLSSHHIGRNFVANLSYELPRTNKSGILGHILDGWQTTTVVRIADGYPLSLDGCGDRARRDRIGSCGRPNLIPGGDSNPVLGGPEQYFDVSQFAWADLGYWGTLGRNTLIAPGMATVDLSLQKHFPLPHTSNGRLRFRAELFNLFNRANFGAPNTTVFDSSGRLNPDAGTILRTTTRSREMQLGLQFVF
jgi:hypothetical protein